MRVPLHSGVLVLHEKHGRLYYHIPNLEELHKVALKVLWGRMTSGNWYVEPQEPESPGFTEEAIQALPKALQTDARLTLVNYRRAVHEYEAEAEWFQDAQRALKEQDGKSAWQLLTARNDAEYERVTLEPYHTGY